MLYFVVKWLVRFGLIFYFRKIHFSRKYLLSQKGPLLLACNHPNSFLDAMIIGACFKKPVHFLARGDAFKNRFASKILTALKAVPVHRLKEGKEHLALNDSTFDKCMEILERNGIILIFCEGLCMNQWQLRPLKKGAARIALRAWNQLDQFKVLPVAFNYSSFNLFSKTVIVNFGDFIYKWQLNSQTGAEQVLEFNQHLHNSLSYGMLLEDNKSIPGFLLSNVRKPGSKGQRWLNDLKTKQIKLKDGIYKKILKKLAPDPQVNVRKDFFPNLIFTIILTIPAFAGYFIHLPFYLPIKKMIKEKTRGTVFYHSALFGALLLLYPFYILLFTIIIYKYTNYFAILLSVLIPLFASITLQWQYRCTRILNLFRLTKAERQKLFDLIQS